MCWERLLRSSRAAVNPTLLNPPLNHVAKCHISCLLNTSRDNESISSLCSLFQSFITLSMKPCSLGLFPCPRNTGIQRQGILNSYIDVVEDIGNIHNTKVSRFKVGYFACLIFLQFTVSRGFRVFQISLQNLTQVNPTPLHQWYVAQGEKPTELPG